MQEIEYSRNGILRADYKETGRSPKYTTGSRSQFRVSPLEDVFETVDSPLTIKLQLNRDSFISIIVHEECLPVIDEGKQ